MDEQAKGNPAKVALIVGLVVVAAAASYFATTQASKPVESPVVAHPDDTTGVGPQPFYNPDLPNLGVPAPGDPKFNVKVELDKTKGRNQFQFTVT
ncbi:MAG: hypothetical protein GY842_26935, partial [bacterium]|nr:hypothetical protein [bacterium]